MRPFAAFTLLVFSFFLYLPQAGADIPNRPKSAEREADVPAGIGGGSAQCTLVYFNFCSGWIWLYNGFVQGDEIGVVYDVVNDCGGGGSCCNTIGFWYWRYTNMNRGFTVSYDMYGADSLTLCRTTPSLGSLSGQDPLERWSTVPALGCSNGSHAVAMTARWDKGTLPYLVTDNNEQNAGGGPPCWPIGVGEGTSVYFGNPTTQYCPPLTFTDALGPTDITAYHAFVCEPLSASESASWSDIKGLFR